MGWKTKEQQSAYRRKKYAENPRKVLDRLKLWNDANREKINNRLRCKYRILHPPKSPEELEEKKRVSRERKKQRQKDRYYANLEESRRKLRERYYANRESVIASTKNWQANHPEQFKESHRLWVEKNKYRFHEYRHDRRARISGGGGKFTQREWECILSLYGNMCLCCLSTAKKLVRDHIISLKNGGRNTAENIQPLCRSCNSRKRSKTIDYRFGLNHGH